MAKTQKAGWYPDPQTSGGERRWDGDDWTGETRLPPPGKVKKRRRGGLVVKIALGILLAGVVLIAGCAVLIGAGAEQVSKDSERAQNEIDKADTSSTSTPSGEAKPKVKTVDTARATGDFAIAQASGTADNPDQIRLLVSSAPPQKVSVSYSLVCTQGSGAGSKSGQFNVTTPTSRMLPIPGDPSSCIVSANAQLEAGGRVKVTIKG